VSQPSVHKPDFIIEQTKFPKFSATFSLETANEIAIVKILSINRSLASDIDSPIYNPQNHERP
jgi:hypothetical protein